MSGIPSQRGRERPSGVADVPEPERTQWVVIASNSNGQVIAIGNAYGKAIGNEQQAQRLADRLEDKFALWNFLVLPITSRKEWGQ